MVKFFFIQNMFNGRVRIKKAYNFEQENKLMEQCTPENKLEIIKTKTLSEQNGYTYYYDSNNNVADIV